MIIDTSCYPTNLVDLAWRHDGEPFSGERLIEVMDGPYIINGKPRRIDTAFIQPPQGNTIYTWTDGERSGRESIDDYMAYTVELRAEVSGPASSAASSITRAAARKTAPRRSSSMRRNTASRWCSCRPTCTRIVRTARSTGCARR